MTPIRIGLPSMRPANKRRHWASPEMWVTCALGPYNFEFMTAVTREIVERYQVDGIFSNRWDGSGMCYCEHCQANFKQASGFDLPRTCESSGPRAGEPISCGGRSACSSSGVFGMPTIRAANPSAAYIANAGGGALSSLDMKTIGELAPTLFADRQARSGVVPPWTNGKNGKEYRATLGRKAIVGIFSVGVEEPYRWKDSVQSGGRDSSLGSGRDRERFAALVYQVLRRRCTTAAGSNPSKNSMAGTTATSGICETSSRSPAWPWCTRSRLPRSTAANRRGAKVEDHTLGFYQALVEGRIPFEMVHDRLLDPAHTVSSARWFCRTSRRCRMPVCATARSSSNAAAAWWLPTRRRSTTNGVCGAATSVWRICSGCQLQARWKAR